MSGTPMSDRLEVELFVASGPIERWRAQDGRWRPVDDWIDAWKRERQELEARWLREGKFDD